MRHLKFLFLPAALFLLIQSLKAQDYPKGYFDSPLAIPLSLAGNFGEIRLNHFHYGLDLRTQGKEGLNVFASASGYVSRVKISGTGYGKVIYITHPNGFVTVYGHLSTFQGQISEYVKNEQYKKKVNDIELFPEKNELPVKKGQLIALSGNSGGSQGPHLHFEIRDEKTEEVINPLLFGFPVKDQLPPQLVRLVVYNLESNGSNPVLKKSFPLKFSGGAYRLSGKDTIQLTGIVGFGLEVYDRETSSGSRNGVYSMMLSQNGKTIYTSNLERFTFDQSRFVNAHMDYSEKLKTGNDIQRLYLLPNNCLPIYKSLDNRGIQEFCSDSLFEMKLIVSDVYGNCSGLKFYVQGMVSKPGEGSGQRDKKFKYNKTNIFEKNGVMVDVPAFCLYDDLDFIFSVSPPFPGCKTPVYKVHNKNVPLQCGFILSIPVDTNLPYIREKGTIVSVGEKGIQKGLGGEYLNGKLMIELKSFGNYSVAIDTVPPVINPATLKSGKPVTNVRNLIFTVGDNLSRIVKWNAWIDGEWNLMEYDPKTSRMVLPMEIACTGKKHELKIDLTDDRGNMKNYKTTFVR